MDTLENDWIQRAIEAWRAQKVKLNGGATTDAIQQAENILQFTFPDDFVEFYKKVNGFQDFDCTINFFSIWRITRIITEYEKDDADFIPFCDFLINSHQLGFIKGEMGMFTSYNRVKQIATSFKEVIKMILEDAKDIY